MKSTTELMTNYYNWLKESYSITSIDSTTDRIVTPFLDPLNDNICLYVTKNKDSVQISDDGYTLNNLSLMGINMIDTRDAIVKEIIDRFGVTLTDNELSVLGTVSDFPAMKFKLTSAILQINDLIFTKKSNVKNLFKEEVLDFLDNNDFGGLPKHRFSGRTGIDYEFSYVIPKRKNKPYKILDIINDPSRNLMMEAAFKFNDIKNSSELSKDKVNYYIIYNGDSVSESSQRIAEDTNIDLVSWKNRDSLLSLNN